MERRNNPLWKAIFNASCDGGTVTGVADRVYEAVAEVVRQQPQSPCSDLVFSIRDLVRARVPIAAREEFTCLGIVEELCNIIEQGIERENRLVSAEAAQDGEIMRLERRVKELENGLQVRGQELDQARLRAEDLRRQLAAAAADVARFKAERDKPGFQTILRAIADRCEAAQDQGDVATVWKLDVLHNAAKGMLTPQPDVTPAVRITFSWPNGGRLSWPNA